MGTHVCCKLINECADDRYHTWQYWWLSHALAYSFKCSTSFFDITFLEFTYISIFYQFIKDIGIIFITSLYYFDIIAKLYLDITFIVLMKNFVILRVSGQSANGMYHLWMHLWLLFSFLYHLGCAVMWCSYLSYLHCITSFCLVSALLLFVLSSVNASQESGLGTVVNMSTP